MGHKVQLKLKYDNKKEESVVAAVFDDDEWSDLCRFRQYAEELAEVQLLKEGFNPSISVRVRKDQPLEMEAKLPDWDDVLGFLHRLRPLVLESEPTYFHRIRKILSRRIENERIHGLLKFQKTLYSGKRFQSGMRITLNETVVNSDQVVNDWLNAFEYHRDADKREKINALTAVIPDATLRTLILMMLVDRAKAIFTLAEFVQLLEGKQSKFQTRNW